MKTLARLLATWACLGMLVGPSALSPAADPLAAPLTTKEEGKSERLDLSFIPADAVAAFIVRPQAVLMSPEAELLPTEIFSAQGLKEAGFDPVKIHLGVLLVGSPYERPPLGGPSMPFGAVLKFSDAYSKELVVAKLGRTEEVTVDGKTFVRLKGRSNSEPLFYFPDDRTLIFAMPDMITQMISGKESESPLVSLLRKSDLSSDLTAVVSVEMIRGPVKQMMGRLPPLPPPFQDYFKLPDLLSAIVLRVDVGEKFRASLNLRARDEAAGEEVEQMINGSLEFAKQMLRSQMATMPRRGNDPVAEATKKYAERLSDKVFSVVKPVRKGQNVVISVETGTSIATIGMLTALLLPAMQAARSASNRNTNMNKLRQIALALHNHHSAKRHFPAQAICDPDGKPLLSWRVTILPYLEEKELYNQFHLDEPWDSEHNKPLVAKMPDAFAKAGRPNDGRTVFQVPFGKGLAFEGTEGLPIRSFKDGTAKTILAIEVNDDRAVPWTKPDDLEVDMDKPLDGLCGGEEGGFACAARADGSVFSFTNQIDIETLKALFTRNGGERVDETLIR